MDELPPKLKVDLIMHMYRKRYSVIKFFNRKDECFITWITPLLKAVYYQGREYIYKEGEQVQDSKHNLIPYIFSILSGQRKSRVCSSQI